MLDIELLSDDNNNTLLLGQSFIKPLTLAFKKVTNPKMKGQIKCTQL